MSQCVLGAPAWQRLAPVNEMRRRGIPVALGIDQSNIADDRDMTLEMKLVRGRRLHLPTDETAGIVISDAIDGVVHNAAGRGTLQTAAVRNELVKLIASYLCGSSTPT